MFTNIRESVLAQMEEKIAAGERLSDAIAREDEARAALSDAVDASAQARRAALASGWTEGELKKLGLVPSPRAAKARTARRQSSSTAPVTETHDDAQG